MYILDKKLCYQHFLGQILPITTNNRSLGKLGGRRGGPPPGTSLLVGWELLAGPVWLFHHTTLTLTTEGGWLCFGETPKPKTPPRVECESCVIN
jgi:hypothetical protein